MSKSGAERAKEYREIASRLNALREEFRSEIMAYGLPGDLRQLSSALGMHDAAYHLVDSLALLLNGEMEELQPPLRARSESS